MSPIDWAVWHEALVRRLPARAGFEKLAFDAPADELWTVGSHRHAGEPEPLQAGERLWTAYRS